MYTVLYMNDGVGVENKKVNRKVNKNFFKKWTSEMAYVLGFFAADGYMWVSGRGARYFGFQITDKELLYTIRDVLESNHKISKRLSKNKNHDPLYRLQIGSKEMYTDLLDLGMLPNKTHILRLPNIPDKYFADFVRGYFDGDGNVWVGDIHKERKTKHTVLQTVFTSGSKKFLEMLKMRLVKFGLRGGSIIVNKKGYKRLQYSVKDSIILSRLMYENCTNKLYFERKCDKFKKYIQSKQ